MSEPIEDKPGEAVRGYAGFNPYKLPADSEPDSEFFKHYAKLAVRAMQQAVAIPHRDPTICTNIILNALAPMEAELAKTKNQLASLTTRAADDLERIVALDASLGHAVRRDQATQDAFKALHQSWLEAESRGDMNNEMDALATSLGLDRFTMEKVGALPEPPNEGDSTTPPPASDHPAE